MPQSVLIQVGQCGNQIGFRFWESVVKEYSTYNVLNPDDNSYFLKPKQNLSSFSYQKVEESYNARGVLIDMEPGVISEGLRGSLNLMFSKTQILTDASGSGNNWARGHYVYGQKYSNVMINMVRKEVEDCDNIESFLLVFSLGGGTGSGLGTSILKILHEEFSEIPRLVFTVIPSEIDDVITSPYNAVLANNVLADHAKCIIPFENQVLSDICIKKDRKFLRADSAYRQRSSSGQNKGKPFEDMNDLISSTISDFTSSCRLPGKLNVDMNDIVINMTPFPRLKYLLPSVSPFIFAPEDCKIEQVFSDLFSTSHQLFNYSTKKGVWLSAAVLCRGSVSVTDVQSNINRLGQSVQFAPWNENGWKYGLCDFPPPGRHLSLLMLSNTSGITHKFQTMKARFCKMYQKKAHIHHFSDIDSDIKGTFDNAVTCLTELIKEYENIETLHDTAELPRPFVI